MVEPADTSRRSDSVSGLQPGHSDEPKRARWNSPVEFTITCIGYAVGLGNFWRFPYLCYSHGGGAFLVPYTLVLLFIGIPLFLLELGVGQKAQIGATHAWANMHPALAGIGYAGTSATFMVALYYNVIVAWAIWFLVHSFTAPLPWSEPDLTNATSPVLANLSSTNATITNAALTFFEVDTLHCRGERPTCSWRDIDDWTLVQPSLFDAGGLVGPLVPCLAVGWFLIWLCVCKGIESLGRVAWFTAIFPYIVLTILLVRGLTLPGAEVGLRFYLEPKFDKLLDIQVWIAAASQIFYSTGVGWGTLVAFASYNDHHHNFVRDAWVVPLINCGTSFLAGLVVFSVLGFMATTAGISVEELEMEGSGLAFVAYPQAIAQMPGAPFFAVLFFVMVICLGVDSQFAMVETVRHPPSQ
jgi:SNF family Na+-dependent transporter